MGTGWEVLPVIELDGVPVGDGACGAVTARLRAAYQRLVRGDHAGHEDWRTPVWPNPTTSAAGGPSHEQVCLPGECREGQGWEEVS